MQVILLAPGAGLGHLVRAVSIAIALADLHIESVVATNSFFAETLAKMTHTRIVWIRRSDWKRDVCRYIREQDFCLLVMDSFPFGIEGELMHIDHTKLQILYLARILKLRTYLSALSIKSPDPLFNHAAVIEPLNGDLEEYIRSTGVPVSRLSGRIRFPSERFVPNIPVVLQRVLDAERTALIVHSGPEQEVIDLVRTAEQYTEYGEFRKTVLISPRQTKISGIATYNYFPASHLFPAADCIISGCGYNMIAETRMYRAKHTAVGLFRKYDNQQFRLTKADWGSGDGCREITEVIQKLL